MNKKVLAIYYSQTGQLGDIISNFTAPLVAAGNSVETVVLRSKPGFPFPWTSTSFFDVMPDCVLGVARELEPVTLLRDSYDLIILGYQAWFLSPCIPVNTLLQDPVFSRVLSGTPVITVTGARNMWISAYGRLASSLRERGAVLVGNVALVDRHPNLVSFVTILYWMFAGKKDRYLNLFPPPGVSPSDVAGMASFAAIVQPYLESGHWEGLQPALGAAGAVDAKPHLLFIERNGSRIFGIWARVIVRKKNRRPWLAAFKYYIIFALCLLGPVVYVVTQLIVRPLFGTRVKSLISKLNNTCP